MLDKANLRKQIKSERLSISKEEKDKKNKAIFDALINTDIYKNAKSILTYISTPNEVDTYKFIEYALNNGKCIAAPISSYDDCTMKFVEISDTSKLVKSKYDIYEPVYDQSKVITDYKNCICIVPGLAFDISGNRLGYGKGFYDRFLRSFNQPTVGMCYDCFLWKQLGADNYDVPVDIIITENKIINTES